ncbi:hypothetical protein QVD17_14380 [Tagetes erecta]|uniref:Uncharacterized protein n=1 Tax=Tagetes erecta TaxID=13708 RepID=A0AAD8L1K6_TARER|nr:hypothetical protein QVD17_14380 [Tagetes erecta]
MGNSLSRIIEDRLRQRASGLLLLLESERQSSSGWSSVPLSDRPSLSEWSSVHLSDNTSSSDLGAYLPVVDEMVAEEMHAVELRASLDMARMCLNEELIAHRNTIRNAIVQIRLKGMQLPAYELSDQVNELTGIEDAIALFESQSDLPPTERNVFCKQSI